MRAVSSLLCFLFLCGCLTGSTTIDYQSPEKAFKYDRNCTDEDSRAGLQYESKNKTLTVEKIFDKED